MSFDISIEWQIFKRKVTEKIWMFVAWKLPKTLVMWATIRLIAYATQGKYGKTIVPELSAMDAVKRWDTA